MKVLHLPTSTGGNSWGLSQAEKALGLESEVMIDSNNWLNYKSDICLNIDKEKDDILFKKMEAFLSVKDRYDVFHFNFGQTLVDFFNHDIHLCDLPFYNGKKIMTYNGWDARQKPINLNEIEFSIYHQKNCYETSYCSDKWEKYKKVRIEKVGKYIDHIFALNPDLMNFLPKDKTTFLPYTIAGWDDITYKNYTINKKIKIIHSPSKRVVKGSKFILKALENLQKKYKNIEIEIIENVPNNEALKKYQEADIIIDQVLLGWYGAFAVEAMKMGKPVAVYIREEDLKFISNNMKKDLNDAIININQNNIETVLEKYIQNTDMLYKKSQAAVDFVHKWHNPLSIAEIVKEVYESI